MGLNSVTAISVIMPVFNGVDTLGRAVESVLGQTLQDWELVIVNDGSSDDSRAAITSWAHTDRRVRAVHCKTNNGQSYARNVAVGVACAPLIAYLDCDDEYYSDYLQTVVALLRQSDVVVSDFDICDPLLQNRTIRKFDIANRRALIFSRRLAIPLAVAHGKQLFLSVGGFNELLWRAEEIDLWRRMARAGASFAFSGRLSGIYWRRPDGQNRTPKVPQFVRQGLIANRMNGKALYESPTIRAPMRRCGNNVFLFASPHCILDPSNGAAIATIRALAYSRTLGFDCEVICGAFMNPAGEQLLEEAVAQHGLDYEVKKSQIGSFSGRLLFTRWEDVPITIFCGASTVGFATSAEERAFCEMVRRRLARSRIRTLITYGGGIANLDIIDLARTIDIPILFWLHNFAYCDPSIFEKVDRVIVPSATAREIYWEAIGLDTHVLPNVVADERIRPQAYVRKYLTFVNPQYCKGASVFRGILECLRKRRKDIPVLIVAGRSDLLGEECQEIIRTADPEEDIKLMETTTHPGTFYGLARVVVVPSIWRESFGLVAAEAMYNGIPVLASNRGALPEIVGEGGYLFDIPARYTPQTREIPTAEEVEPWVETIIRLWDNPQEYAAACERARKHAQRWHPDRLAPIYREFFSNLAPQPFPPLAPPGVR
ncbi:MAG: glycosyltransferase [Planctomycetota bacterium]|nr:glycosyltransferase [Planctomycetota bacterium]